MMKRNGLVAALSIAALLVAGALILSLLNGRSVAQARSAVPAAQFEAGASLQAASTPVRTLTVVGEGKVRVKPDMAQINIGIEVVGASVKEASGQAEDIMNGVINAIKAEGVEDKDIQTSGYNIWLERPYSPEGMPTENTLYHVNNTVIVTIRNLDKVGTILDATVEAGANNIYGVTFNVADPKPLMSEARSEAVSDAQAKAKELASLNQVTLGDVISVSEVIGGAGGFYPAYNMPMAAEGMGGGGGPIVPGELELTAQLQVVYAIQ